MTGGKPGHGWGTVLRRQPASIIDGRVLCQNSVTVAELEFSGVVSLLFGIR
jgi:hypothetical protein